MPPFLIMPAFYKSLNGILPVTVPTWLCSTSQKIVAHFHKLKARDRQVIAIAASMVLHLLFLLLLLPSKTGLASFGTTGLGTVNGPGMAVTLVEANEIEPPQASVVQAAIHPTTENSTEAVATPAADDPMEDSKPVDDIKPLAEASTQNKTEAVTSDSTASSDSTAAATAGAHGQNGLADMDLWTAIAPCWNKLADQDTIGAVLTISFDDTGQIAAPPVIERDLTQPITRQTLKSEAQALQALAACGAYSMVKGQQNITVQFPASGQARTPVPVEQTTAMASPRSGPH